MEIKPQELRIGNLLHREDGTGVLVDALTIVEASQRQVANGGTGLKGIALTPEWLDKFGFNKLPHFNVTNSFNKDIGRNRIISVGSVGTGNEMIWLCEINATDKNKIDDLVCMRNYDYDGITHVHQLQNLYFALTGKELAIDNKSL